jgi:hypothetical protein
MTMMEMKREAVPAPKEYSVKESAKMNLFF